jgi:MFS family permease
MSTTTTGGRPEKRPALATGDPGGPGQGAADALATEKPRKLLRALRNREFALFWSAQAVSQTGTWMQQFAQGWVVTNLASSAFALASVNLAASIPILLLTPFGGVAADRMDRRRILLVTQSVLAMLAVALGMLIHAGHLHLWHIWLIAGLLGVATAYDLPAYQSFFPHLVEREDLPQAIALNQATFHGSRIVGPAIASWFVAAWGMAAAFFANSASFLAVIGSLLVIKPRAAIGGTAHRKLSLAEGVRYVREQPQIMALLGLTVMTTTFVFPNAATLMPFYAKHVLVIGPGGLGVMMAVSGIGAFLGAVFLLVLPRQFRLSWITPALVVITLALCALASSRRLAFSVTAVAIVSFGIAKQRVISNCA